MTTKATYTANGSNTYTCTRCGQTQTEPIPKLLQLKNTIKVTTAWTKATSAKA